MKGCVECGREFPDDVQFCPIDGQPLEAKPQVNDSDPLVGTVLDDKYRLDKKIGEGGMGAVYRATHIHMDSAFAVKLLHRTMVADAQAVERFRREARAAARIRHANAVSVTDFGVTKEGTVYLVMEYLEGGDLRDKLRKSRVMSPHDSTRIMVQTCAAIEEAHRKGIVHRDLKPDNIWLLKIENSEDVQIKVLDFGIAKLKTPGPTASNLTQQGMIVGTPHYMSPEQCRGEELDARSDIYSLGIILYEMMTGDVPFRAPTPVGVVLKHANELPVPMREKNPSVPEAVEAVVMKSLAKNREDRQPSAAALARDLVEAVRLSGDVSFDMAGIPGTNDLMGRVPSTGSRTAAGTEFAPAPPAHPGTQAQDRQKTRPVGGSATVAMTSQQPSPGTSSTAAAAGGTQVMASGMATPATMPERGGRASADVAPMPAGGSKTMIMAAGAVVLVAAIAAAVWFATRETATNENANTNTVVNTNAGGTVGSGPPPGMVLIPGGKFMMGTDDPSADVIDKPAHEIVVKDFYLDQHEVTNEEYQQFVKQTGRKPPDNWNGTDFPAGEGKFPVVNVSWYDAKAYAEWAGKRLPTEAEWEYAAAGADGRAYPWGKAWSPQLSNSLEDNRKGPMAVGSYPRGATPEGIYDMAGNVAEWVEDVWAPYPASEAKPDPNCPDCKSYRGGTFSAPKERLKTTYRWYDDPNLKFNYLGFRCAKDAPQ